MGLATRCVIVAMLQGFRNAHPMGFERPPPSFLRRTERLPPSFAHCLGGRNSILLKFTSAKHASAQWSKTPSFAWKNIRTGKVSQFWGRKSRVRQIREKPMQNQRRNSALVGPAGLEPATRPL